VSDVDPTSPPEASSDDPPEQAHDIPTDSIEPTEDPSAEPEVLEVEDLVAALEAVSQERDHNLDQLQRVSAEFANFRKQTDKRNTEFAAQAGARLAEALLPVLDACDAAAQQGVEGVD